MKKAKKLRDLFNDNDKVVRIVGAHDGLGAKLIEKNGFDGIWASGLEISASHAVPDANILTMSQYLERACEMNDAVDIPVVADCDTGYGNVNNVIHTVKKYEAAGIAGICIEDKLFPKVNSYIPGRQELASIAEFVGKIMAAKNVQNDPDFMVIARVEALIAGWGMEEALKRAENYVNAGADAILIHSKSETPDQIEEFCRLWNKKAPLVVVPTTYPMLHTRDMPSLGVKMVVYANHCLRSSVKAMNSTLDKIKKAGDLTTIASDVVAMSDIFELQGMKTFKESEKRYLKKGDKPVSVIIPAAGDPSYEESLESVVRDYPIAMLDINGKPILDRTVEVFNKVGINDISVVTGYNAERFKPCSVQYVFNEDYKNTSQLDSIMMAADGVETDVMVSFSDILFDKEIVYRLLETSEDIVLVIDSAISQNETRPNFILAENDPIEGDRKILSSKLNKIVKIGKDLKDSNVSVNYEFVGLSYFSKKGFAFLKDVYDEAKKDNNTDFSSVIQKIIDSSGCNVYGVEVNGGWIEIRSFENYKIAHSVFL